MSGDAAAISRNVVQVQTPMDDEVDIRQSVPYQHGQFPRQDSASSALPAREAAAGFKGALKKVANGIAGDTSLTASFDMLARGAHPPRLNICLTNTPLYHLLTIFSSRHAFQRYSEARAVVLTNRGQQQRHIGFQKAHWPNSLKRCAYLP